MTSKEKAEELVLKFKELPQEGTMMFYLAFEISKQYALIAVDEIINNSIEWLGCKYQDEEIKYWQEGKQEIEKL